MSGCYHLSNGVLEISVRSKGGELTALIMDKTDYLWHGDPHYWKNKAPNLFPVIGRRMGGAYTVEGTRYTLDAHGFVRNRELDCVEKEGTLWCTLESDRETRSVYPFDFLYRVGYRLSGSVLTVIYEVENREDGDMYFGIGGHPGFNVPLEKGLDFENYRIVFCDPCRPRRILFSPEGLVTGCRPYPLRQDRILPLRHSLFDEDAVVLTAAAKQVRLESAAGTKSVTVSYPGFDYVGFWHRPDTDAPYLCIEPWSSLPARFGVVEEMTAQPGMIKLTKGGEYHNEWTIALQ